MIEPQHAGRLGVSQYFVSGDEAAVERAAGQLQGLGMRRLRVELGADWLDDADGRWCCWLLSRLAADCDLLVCFDLGDASAVPKEFLRLLNALPGITEAVEVCGRTSAVLDACKAVRGAGLLAVLGVDTGGAVDRLLALDPAGDLANVDVIGLHDTQTEAAIPGGWAAIVDTISQVVPAPEIWITQAGACAGPYDSGAQVLAFTQAMAAPAERIYWCALSHSNAKSSHGTCGLFDAVGQKRLLGRLLDGGVAELERMAGAVNCMKMPALSTIRPMLVTGGAGFIGANLANRLATDGHHVLIYDALARAGVERNLHWLARRHPSRISFALGDLRDEPALAEAATTAGAVFHLAGQVAVTTSMVHPLTDFEVNARGTICLLEAIRQRNPTAPLVFASTNKVYGDLADVELVREGDCYLPSEPGLRTAGVREDRPLCFHTPYGCSKGTADQYVLDYAHSFGLRTAVLRMSCIYGERQLGTEDQGWVAHFLLKAIAGQTLTIYGDGRQVRDVLHVGDAVAAYIAAWSKIAQVSGRAYNLGGGPANAISLLQLVSHIEDLLGRRVEVEFAAWRPGDQRYFVADTGAARRDLELAPALGWRAGVARLAEHFSARISAEAAQ